MSHNQNDNDIQQKISSSEKKMEKVIMGWFVEDPVMLGAWCLVDKVPDPSQKTIGIDSRTNPPTVKYNPNFVSVLTQEQLECIMASEGFKILLRHPTTRLQTPKVISSLASQITVDQLIMGNPLGINESFPMPKKFGLEPNSFFEDYFRKLLDQMDKTKQQLKVMFGSSEKKDGDGKSSENASASGQGGEKSDQYTSFSNSSDALKDYFNPEGSSNQDWQKNDLFDAEVNQMINEKKGSSKDWGKFTGNAMGEIVAANTPKISYKDVLRRFNVSVMSAQSISSRMKINRRYDIAAPGYRRQYKSKVLFAVDASGSMSEDDLAEGFSVVNSVCKHAEVTYMLFDTEIKLVEKKLRKAKQSFKITGRGGTDFNEVCKYAEEHCADGIVIYTDGEAPAPAKPKGIKVLWLMTSKEKHPPVKWGFTAVLDRFENTH